MEIQAGGTCPARMSVADRVFSLFLHLLKFQNFYIVKNPFLRQFSGSEYSGYSDPVFRIPVFQRLIVKYLEAHVAALAVRTTRTVTTYKVKRFKLPYIVTLYLNGLTFIVLEILVPVVDLRGVIPVADNFIGSSFICFSCPLISSSESIYCFMKSLDTL